MYPEFEIMQRRRPRRTLEHLFGDDEIVLPPGVTPFNPDAGILRPRRMPSPQMPEMVPMAVPDTLTTRPRRVMVPVRPDDEFAPYQGAQPQGTFVGDAPSPDSMMRPARPAAMALRTDGPRLDPEMPRARPDRPSSEPFGSSGEPFEVTRSRRALPRDYVADAAQYLRDVENQPVKRSRLKSAGVGLVRGGIPGAITGALQPEMYGEIQRDRKITRARERLGRDLALETHQAKMAGDAADIDYKAAQTDWMRQRPDIEANKAAEQQRRTLTSIYNRLPEFDPADAANADLVDAMTVAGLPVVPKSRANQLRFVQDARTGEWKVISGDRSTGEATGRPVGSGDGALVTTPTSQIASEDRAASRESRERVATANRQSRETIAELNRRARASGTRGDPRTEARLTRAISAITQLENLRIEGANGPVQDRAANLEKAAAKAAEIRQLYGDVVEVGYGGDSEGRQWPYAKIRQQRAQGAQQSGAMGRSPDSDGKHHYTAAEIRSQAEAAGVSYESLYDKLKGDKRVVIDQ